MKVFITGGTGFLGRYLLKCLLKSEKIQEIYLLTRGARGRKLQREFENEDKIHLIVGDLTNPDIFNDSEKQPALASTVDTVIHLGALYDLEAGYSESYMSNVVGTQNILYFVNNAKSVKNFYYVSTVAVSGTHQGIFLTDELDVGQSFDNAYAKTKFLAEQMVRHRSKVKTTIFRPAIVVGDSKKGTISKIDGPYYFLDRLKKVKGFLEKMNFLSKIPFPLSNEARIHMIPVDVCAKSMCTIILNPRSEKNVECYHLVSPSPLAKDFVMDTFLHLGLNASIVPIKERRLYKTIFHTFGLPSSLLHYVYLNIAYDENNLLSHYPDITHAPYKKFRKIFGQYLDREAK